MPQTALFIERDATYHHMSRKLRASCVRAEWDDLGYRQAAIDAAWKQAIDGIRSEGYEFVCPMPVTLYCDPISKEVVYADIRGPQDAYPHWISAHGERLIGIIPNPGLVKIRTSYARWAEGPLVNIQPDLITAPKTTDDPEIQRLRHQNSALREAIDFALAQGANDADLPQTVDPHSDKVDFRLRGVFRKRDYRVLVSKQAPDEGSKIITSEGLIE